MTVSIIIPVKTWQNKLEECIRRCRELDFADFEILVLPDSREGFTPQTYNPKEIEGAVPLRIIPTGAVNPGQKRDIAMNHAKGEILAFIDDDAYPERDWLKNAVKNFTYPEVAAVGGPAITPRGDGIRQEASGLVYSSPLVSAKYIYRYLPKGKRQVEDYPSCNFLIRKSIMQELGGFKTHFWPGEDTKLCLEVTRKLGKKIVYDPAAMVYHHRRPLFLPHLRQVADYALHRGYFAKRHPETSFRPVYFAPSLLLSAIVAGSVLSVFFAPFRIIYLSGLSLYLLLVLFFSIPGGLRLIPLVFLGTVLTHLTYGLFFIKGLASLRLREER